MKRIILHIHTFCLLTLLCPAGLAAQSVIRGIVIDRESQLPVEAATVQLTRGNVSLPINYTLSNNEGTFTLTQPKRTDSLLVSVSLLGYQTQQQAVHAGQTLRFEMEPQVFSLKEVEIRPGRVWGQQDTINYDVTRFLSPKDQSIKDVLRKLPGIDIDDLGKISYNGKEIRNFYVEGLDLTNGKYKQISENLRADALQISRSSQSAYLYKGNNTGQDVSGEQNTLTESPESRLSEPKVPQFLLQPSFSAPLKKERWLFNHIHSLSANRLYKLNENTQLRINAGYIHDLRTQERGSETTYYQSEDTIHLTEQSDSRIRSDQANLNIGVENNSQERYLKNQFSATGDWQSSLSHITENTISTGRTTLDQRIKTPNLDLRNNLRTLWSLDKYTLEAQSSLRYHSNAADLRLDNHPYPMNLRDFYTDNSFSFLKKSGSLTQRYTVGINGEISNIEKSLQTYLSPDYQWNTYKWTLSLSVPLRWTGYTGVGFSRISVNPSLSIIYKLNYAWRFTVHASYKERYGEMTDLYDRPYQTDYRNSVWNCGILPVYRQQLYSVYGEYKNTAREFFATVNLTHNREWYNRIYEQRIENGQIQRVSLPLSNHGSGYTVKSTLSKGFYDLGLKTSLLALLNISKAEQISGGQRLPYQYRLMRLEPKVIWTPNRHWETSYQTDIRYGGSKIGERTRLAPLWNVTQQVQLSYIFSPIEASLSVDHYHNDVNEDQSVNAVFADFSVLWKSRRWQITATATNLFDKRTYAYTRYASLESYTSWVHIRPREFLVAIRYQL